ncbi:cysteine desulfurase/selenocysteine lyase [Chryseobacterium sp. SORGH_AS909]|uniref:cysteine desulfurase n=1 Tax=unclassified Chryseobacterium TaxID=2593645 RepID=UPI002780FDF8|nr:MULTISPECIES: cysteine desulfurase [unclassified Chryseobacterium]MDQ1102305.1 cysteine desulfurase/selenocysteine lyase [Chryseobacterium sp. SORGH_AS_1048]MDR6085742.1 cysteine desulfurase/selenocysteine lyase [Chryseobacterium sp. SORGH_AS_0909]MDR6130107.1 cysteine desulfurase/selenocysteine lyase [Chryseobacterium sp. SORGH_AS_1175]MDT3407767.1 cysteine desulfurase/selenocysteine lyase [Pseudacidovorax intermedius]
MLDIQEIRNQFSILNREVNGKPLVYLDNAATSQKPDSVLQVWNTYYTELNANVHRGIHTLSQLATEEMELSRRKIQKFINAKHDFEVIFTKGTTEGINLISYILTQKLKEDDEIVISYLEHHSNIVPWQLLCERTGAKLRVIPMDENGVLQIGELDTLFNERTKVVSVNHVSNALGVVNPVEEIIAKARKNTSAYIVIDGAQAAPHFTLDVQKLDCDFYVFSGHKMYAPMGTGILYGKQQILESLPPFHGGGEMIATCSFERTTYAGLPFKYEAGTPNVGGNIALGAAIDFIEQVGQENIQQHENALLEYAQRKLLELDYIKVYAEKAVRTGVVSFNLEGVGISSDVGMILDKMGVAVRTGHHCTQPIMSFFNIAGTVRASFAVYNTFEEIDLLVEGVKKAHRMLA